MPFSLGAEDSTLFDLSSGANRRGSRTTDVVIVEVRPQVCEDRGIMREVDNMQRLSSLCIKTADLR